MMFDLGNLLAIGITLILLLAYRILDRDNRSLEKVKKYADRLRDELAAYADRRSEDLKAYAIDLEVHQKAAKEVLRRVQVAEEALAAKADRIGGMAERIAEYDKALLELKEMSARVDQNLAVIHDESAFVDGVARTLKATKVEMAALVASVPDIRQGIASDSRAMMESLQASFSDRLEAAMADSSARVEALRQAAAAASVAVGEANEEGVKAAEERFRAIEAQLADAFRRAREEGERLEDATFQRLKDQIEARGARLGEALEERFNGLRDQAKERIAEIQGLLKGFKADWRKDADALAAEAKADAAQAAERVEARVDEAEARVAKAETLYEERYARVEAKVLETAQALQVKVRDQLKAFQEDTAARQSAIRASIKEGIADTKHEAESVARELAESLSASTA